MSTPNACPYCGATDLTEITEWESRSLEPMDRDNTAVLTEYQCGGACEGRSFWVGGCALVPSPSERESGL